MELPSKEVERALSKKEKKEILEKIYKAGSDEYETSWDENGIPRSKKKSEIIKGKKSKAGGLNFEARVRKDLEIKGWTVDKWSNNVDLELKKIIPAKRKFNPFSKIMTLGTGFPDFVCFQNLGDGRFDVIGVEVKTNGYLDKIEKEKCRFLIERDIFNEIWVAKKKKIGREIKIEYKSFVEKEEITN